MLFGKVRVFQFSLNFHHIFIFIVRHVDLSPLWTLIGLVFRFTTLVTLANTWLTLMDSLCLL